MALADEVQSRYPSQFLKELTNPRNRAATSIDTAQLGRAATAVSDHFFPLFVGKSYDSTIQGHVECAVMGVVALLYRWGAVSMSRGEKAFAKWEGEAKAYGKTQGRNRISPTTSSDLEPSDEGTGTVRPTFDVSRFTDLIPELPPLRPDRHDWR